LGYEFGIDHSFAAAVVKGAKPEASKRLIDFLASEKATPTVEKTGMKRPALRPALR
jgi:ABC-type Fe3+ transport system substrate-binding protein